MAAVARGTDCQTTCGPGNIGETPPCALQRGAALPTTMRVITVATCHAPGRDLSTHLLANLACSRCAGRAAGESARCACANEARLRRANHHFMYCGSSGIARTAIHARVCKARLACCCAAHSHDRSIQSCSLGGGRVCDRSGADPSFEEVSGGSWAQWGRMGLLDARRRRT